MIIDGIEFAALLVVLITEQVVLSVTTTGELMAKGYRIDTPIGSFVPKLKLKREITDADEAKNSDVMLDGVDYNPGKRWNEAIEKWLYNGFLRVDNPNVQKLMKSKMGQTDIYTEI